MQVVAEKGHSGVVELLLQAGADVKWKLKEGITALYMAAQHGFDDIVKLLLKYKVGRSQSPPSKLLPIVDFNDIVTVYT